MSVDDEILLSTSEVKGDDIQTGHLDISRIYAGRTRSLTPLPRRQDTRPHLSI